MADDSKDRPLMLDPGDILQWHSRFLRYLDTKSNGGISEESASVKSIYDYETYSLLQLKQQRNSTSSCP
ncbi:hypothetical protein Tco_1193113 [Tanacetum coccineum]